MAGPAPNSKLWSAHENEHKSSGLYLLVGGQVEVSDADKQPVLTEGEAKDPNLLVLDLSIADCSDPPVDTAVWKAAKFHREVEVDQYRRVEVRWDGAAIADFPVIDDRERSQLMDKQAKAQNTSAGVKAKVKKGGSGAKKKAEAPKTTAEKVKKAAKVVKKKKAGKKVATPVSKKSAKKSAKKAAKKVATRKPAKKAAKKSALNKFVRKLVKKLTPSKKKAKGKKKR